MQNDIEVFVQASRDAAAATTPGADRQVKGEQLARRGTGS
jgi:hypothetical protein